MKLSKYNIVVPINEDIFLVSNTFSGAFVLMKKNIAQMIKNNDISLLAKTYEIQYKKMIEEGVIIEDDINELSLVENLKFSYRFSTNHYHLIINPTLNCNLDCWYCYESHIKSSKMAPDIIQKVLRHLKKQHETLNFSSLTIAFFGGEPFLKSDVVGMFVTEINAFCEKNKIQIAYSVTTNGTLIAENILDTFKQVPVTFQITFDGDEVKHNEIRHYRGSTKGTYNRIIDSLKLISDSMSNYKIIIRINYDSKTLNNISKILDDINFLPRDKTIISLHKVWQIIDKVDKTLLYAFINAANDRKFIVDYHPLRNGGEGCYADRLNQCVVNYNGDIYKCTARDFSTENREGHLESNGNIVWNVSKLIKRMSLNFDETCRECILYPACPGLCSQARLEGLSGKTSCPISFEDLNDILLLNFNQKVLAQEIGCI